MMGGDSLFVFQGGRGSLPRGDEVSLRCFAVGDGLLHVADQELVGLVLSVRAQELVDPRRASRHGLVFATQLLRLFPERKNPSVARCC